ncbi:MAG: lysophospholipid acyltransferase family protein [Nitrospirae bacterium]|nr:lysophospholipid acyltransferase family protein [Nitrospirota bacterium]
MKRVLWFLEAAFFAALSFPVAALPHKMALKAGEILGLSVFYLWGSRRKIAIDNIEKAKGEWQTARGKEQSAFSPEPLAISHLSAYRLAKETFKNLGRSLSEVIKIYYGLGKGIIDSVEIRGADNYHKAKSKNKGVLFITGHCGNWELKAITFGAKIDTITSVARKQNNPYLNGLVENVRAKYDNSVIYKKGALKGIVSVLRKNGNVGILMDQSVLKDEGYLIDFLGRPAWATKMPALIARRTGAAVVPAFLHREGDRHVSTIYPEVELSNNEDAEKAVIEDTKKFSAYIEDYIKQHPTEWLWIHRRWKRT